MKIKLKFNPVSTLKDLTGIHELLVIKSNSEGIKICDHVFFIHGEIHSIPLGKNVNIESIIGWCMVPKVEDDMLVFKVESDYEIDSIRKVLYFEV